MSWNTKCAIFKRSYFIPQFSFFPFLRMTSVVGMRRVKKLWLPSIVHTRQNSIAGVWASLSSLFRIFEGKWNEMLRLFFLSKSVSGSWTGHISWNCMVDNAFKERFTFNGNVEERLRTSWAKMKHGWCDRYDMIARCWIFPAASCVVLSISSLAREVLYDESGGRWIMGLFFDDSRACFLACLCSFMLSAWKARLKQPKWGRDENLYSTKRDSNAAKSQNLLLILSLVIIAKHR